MKNSDKFRFVRQNMKKNKSRIFMTVLATAMGCAFLMMIASVAFGLQKSLINDITEDRSLTEIQIHGRKNGDSYNSLTASDLKAIGGLKNVKAITARRTYTGESALGDFRANQQTIATDFEQETNAGLKLSEGRTPRNGQEALVGYQFVNSLRKGDSDSAYTGDLVGQKMTIKLQQYDPESDKMVDIGTYLVTIVGVLKKPDKEWNADNKIYLDNAIAPGIADDFQKSPPEVNLYAKNAGNISALSKALRAQNYSIYSVADTIDKYNLVFMVMKIGLVFVGTIAVLIASIGIFNTMTMAVTERAQDIGIMKAVGAHPRTIRNVFMLESFGIGLFGAIIGTVVAYALSALVNKAVPPILTSVMNGDRVPDNFLFSSIPLSLTLVSVAISLGVALLSGMRPAARATRIDVLSALRRDL